MQNRKLILVLLFFSIASSAIGQNIIFEGSPFNGVTIEIEPASDVATNDAFMIKYKIRNATDSVKHILLKDHMGFPLGLSATIKNKKGESVGGAYSKHILSATLFTLKELEKERIELAPGEVIEKHINLQDVVMHKDILKSLPPGVYTVSLDYFTISSNRVKIKIN